MAAEYGGRVGVEVVTLKEREGAERYRELRRAAGMHLPVPCVLIEGRLVSRGHPGAGGAAGAADAVGRSLASAEAKGA